MKPTLLIVTAILMIGMADQPPIQTAEYETLGFKVVEYNNKYYRIYDQSGYAVAECDLMGFVKWKQMILLERIGDSRIPQAERDRYKVEYENIARKLDIIQTAAIQQTMVNNVIRKQQFQASVERINNRSDERTKCIRSGGGYSCL